MEVYTVYPPMLPRASSTRVPSVLSCLKLLGFIQLWIRKSYLCREEAVSIRSLVDNPLTRTCYFRARSPSFALAGEGTIPRELLGIPGINEIDCRGNNLHGETRQQ